MCGGYRKPEGGSRNPVWLLPSPLLGRLPTPAQALGKAPEPAAFKKLITDPKTGPPPHSPFLALCGPFSLPSLSLSFGALIRNEPRDLSVSGSMFYLLSHTGKGTPFLLS